jgi:hypothetical protein
MTDFDAVLERLLIDPAFAAALAADPDRALCGYRLDAGEAELLRSQVAADRAADVARVEARTTKSSTFGLFSSLGDWSDCGGAAGLTAAQGAGRLADAVTGGGVDNGAGVRTGLGDAATGPGAGGGVAGGRTGLGDAPDRDLTGLPAVSRLGDAPRAGLGSAGGLGMAEAEQVKGYRNRVDADGDGDWDKATYRGRADGGVDILVDLNRDGRTDFVGHDVDRDWTVDSADYDKDHDGVFDKRMYDDTGDGLLDRTVWYHD